LSAFAFATLATVTAATAAATTAMFAICSFFVSAAFGARKWRDNRCVVCACTGRNVGIRALRAAFGAIRTIRPFFAFATLIAFAALLSGSFAALRLGSPVVAA
jgi:hypothetical protein